MGNKGSPCHLMTHILVNLEDHGGRVEVHLVLVHQHREAPDLLSHRGRHLQQRKCAGEWPKGTWLHSTAPGAPNRLQENRSASLKTCSIHRWPAELKLLNSRVLEIG